MERFITFVHAKDLDALSLKAYIMDVVHTIGIDKKAVIAQCYNGASVCQVLLLEYKLLFSKFAHMLYTYIVMPID